MNPLRWLKKTFGTRQQRESARAEMVLEAVERVGRELASKSDRELMDRAASLRAQAGSGRPLDSLMVETFAVAREAAARTVGMRPFDVQVLGAAALHRGNVVEMKTGEGKTLAATLPVTLSAMTGKGVQVVTVNDYLAARDAEWMGPIYRFMGLSVGVVTEDMDPEEQRDERRRAYAADVTYVTNHELVFDYLRDNLALTLDEVVQRPFHFAVVDEVDLLLLDEARTPLIISGPSGDDPGLCVQARSVVAALTEGRHYQVDHRSRLVSVTDAGFSAMERALGIANLADPEHQDWRHVLHNAMLAHAVYARDVDYIVADEEVQLVDEFTGRVSPDKRFADGLHQALEAKEGVPVRPEDATLAKVSYQNFFALYPRLCGMTGTAATAREEFGRTYGLQVVVLPTHKPMIRRDLKPRLYRTSDGKFKAVASEIEWLVGQGRPVLVGTTSVQESERLSAVLRSRSVDHHVLNAKNHRAEAALIAQAGRSGAVTVSTNMAGRGVDILLGGNPDALAAQDSDASIESLRRQCDRDRQKVVEAGGLALIGTGRHESRRIDDQLRGRSGRQGDPGTAQYFLSLDDPIYRKFGEVVGGAQVLRDLRRRLSSHPEDEPVDDPGILGTLEGLRLKVEVENQHIRHEVLQYDLVIDHQRRTVFAWRRRLLQADPREAVKAIREIAEQAGDDLVHRLTATDGEPEGTPSPGDEPEGTRSVYEKLSQGAAARFGVRFNPADLGPEDRWSPERAAARVARLVRSRLEDLRESLGPEIYAEGGRQILLSTVDDLWTAHLTALERLDESIGLRGYAELNPLTEFRREAAILYGEMLREIRLQAISAICSVELEPFSGRPPDRPAPLVPAQRRSRRRTMKR